MTSARWAEGGRIVRKLQHDQRRFLAALPAPAAEPLPSWFPGNFLLKLQSRGITGDAAEVIQRIQEARNELETALVVGVEEHRVALAWNALVAAAVLESAKGFPLSRWLQRHGGKTGKARAFALVALLNETTEILREVSREGTQFSTHEQEVALRRSLSEVVVKLQSFLTEVYRL